MHGHESGWPRWNRAGAVKATVDRTLKPELRDSSRLREDAVPHAISMRYLLLVCAGLSGAAGLIYEIVWSRQLLLAYGSTTYSTAAVLAGFIGGLALGALLVARLHRRIRRPLTVYMGIEVLVALYGAVSLALIGQLSSLGGDVDLDRGMAGLMLEPLLVGGMAMILPTVAMGAALPVLLLEMDRRGQDALGFAGWIYGANTFGAAVGAASAGFVLLPLVGMTGTLTVAVGLGLAAAAIAWSAAKSPSLETVATGESSTRQAKFGRFPRALALAVFLAGIAGLGYEVVWTRILVLVIGSSTYAFALILTVFIFGVAFGSCWGSHRRTRLRA
ncbi:MAG: hypothetical protein O7F71_10560, partial [Gammaproteobacteria bacterium]|nr:hypothetical protein [Gammaproteobacteria bacterium]